VVIFPAGVVGESPRIHPCSWPRFGGRGKEELYIARPVNLKSEGWGLLLLS